MELLVQAEGLEALAVGRSNPLVSKHLVLHGLPGFHRISQGWKRP